MKLPRLRNTAVWAACSGGPSTSSTAGTNSVLEQFATLAIHHSSLFHLNSAPGVPKTPWLSKGKPRKKQDHAGSYEPNTKILAICHFASVKRVPDAVACKKGITSRSCSLVLPFLRWFFSWKSLVTRIHPYRLSTENGSRIETLIQQTKTHGSW